MRTFAYHRAHSVEDALTVTAAGSSTAFLAGGTTLIDLVKLDVLQPETVIDVNRLPLGSIERTPDGGLRIGANVRNSELAWHQDVKRSYPLLSQAILAGASAQIRNMATTAGNLLQRTRCPYYRDAVSPCNKREPGSGCSALQGYNRMHAVLGGSASCVATHPSDLCVALSALEAVVVTSGPSGTREIPMGDFHLLPGDSPHREFALAANELVVAIQLPPPRRGARSHYLKVRDRQSFEFALASAAVIVRLEASRIVEARVALGGIGTKPWRSHEAEAILRGAPANPATFQAAAEATLRNARPLPYNAFKVPLARATLVRALEIAVEGAETRVEDNA